MATSTSADPAPVENAPQSDGSVTPILNDAGQIIGYGVDAVTQRALNDLSAELGAVGATSPGSDSPEMRTQDFWKVAACVTAVSGFIVTTVFPTARAAKLAVRIGGLVNRYGVKKVAEILTRTYRGSDVNAEAIFKEIAAEAAGISALNVCFS